MGEATSMRCKITLKSSRFCIQHSRGIKAKAHLRQWQNVEKIHPVNRRFENCGNMSKKSCNCNFAEEDRSQCDFCNKLFETFSSFVRHLSHNQDCKGFYGETFEEYKRISRQITKQKWYCWNAHGSNAKQFKEERKKQRQANKKVNYVSIRTKRSECGRAFEWKLKGVYQKYLEKAREKIDEQSLTKKTIRQDASVQALDNTFKESSLDKIFKQITEMNEDDSLILEETFAKLESTYKHDFESIFTEKRKDWRNEKFYDISCDLYSSVNNKAFVDLFDYTTLKAKVDDNTLDTIFLTLVTTEDYFNDEEDLESQMESAYYTVKREEIQKLFEDDIDLENKLEHLVEKAFRKRFLNFGVKY